MNQFTKKLIEHFMDGYNCDSPPTAITVIGNIIGLGLFGVFVGIVAGVTWVIVGRILQALGWII